MNRAMASSVDNVFQRTLTRILQFDMQPIEGAKEVLSLGCMVSTAVVSPTLFEFRSIWLMDISIGALATAGFVSMHLKEKKKYGLAVAPAAVLFSIAAYLKDYAAWVPVIVCSFLLLAAYPLPRLLPKWMTSSPITIGDERESISNGSEAQPGSVQSFDDYASRAHPPLMARYLEQEQEVSGMDRSPTRLSQLFSVHGSDIDLEDQIVPITIALQRVQHMVGLPEEGSFTQPPPASLEGLLSRIFTVPYDTLLRENDEDRRPSSSDTENPRRSSPPSATSNTPLLG